MYSLACSVLVCMETSLVKLRGNIPAQLWMHAPGFSQEDASAGFYQAVVSKHPLQAGKVGRIWMTGLNNLGKLARIADHDNVVCA